MGEIKLKIVEIRKFLSQWDQYVFQRAYDFGIEEFIEAIGFYWFLKGKFSSKISSNIFKIFFVDFLKIFWIF